MKARVTAIESASAYTDGQRRIEITVDGGDAMWRKLHLPEKVLGIIGLCVDDELIVDIVPAKLVGIDSPLGQVIRH